jgi:hypothetical protein
MTPALLLDLERFVDGLGGQHFNLTRPLAFGHSEARKSQPDGHHTKTNYWS